MKYFDVYQDTSITRTNLNPFVIRANLFNPPVGTGDSQRVGTSVFLRRCCMRVKIRAGREEDIIRGQSSNDCQIRLTIVADNAPDFINGSTIIGPDGLWEDPTWIQTFQNMQAGSRWNIIKDWIYMHDIGDPYIDRLSTVNDEGGIVRTAYRPATAISNKVFSVVQGDADPDVETTYFPDMEVTGTPTELAWTAVITNSLLFNSTSTTSDVHLVWSQPQTGIVMTSETNVSTLQYLANIYYTRKSRQFSHEFEINKQVNFKLGPLFQDVPTNYAVYFLGWKDNPNWTFTAFFSFRFYYEDH